MIRKLTHFLAIACTVLAVRATAFNYSALLSGPNEFPANASPGLGTVNATYDDAAHTLFLDVDFSSLLGTTTASHIQSETVTAGIGTAGVATTIPSLPGFPLSVTSGLYTTTLDLTLTSTFSPLYLAANGGSPAAAESSLGNGLAAGKSYFNIHSTAFPGGEIRGFFEPTPVPDATSSGMSLAIAFLALAAWRGFARAKCAST